MALNARCGKRTGSGQAGPSTKTNSKTTIKTSGYTLKQEHGNLSMLTFQWVLAKFFWICSLTEPRISLSKAASPEILKKGWESAQVFLLPLCHMPGIPLTKDAVRPVDR